MRLQDVIPHREGHRIGRVGWLRAAVLGANDGILSTASLIVGVAASGATPAAIGIAGVAGVIAGAMSMAAGEYVSVSSQADVEREELGRERAELALQPEFEREELAAIYVGRGLTPELASQVAQQLMAHDALGAHARDELGLSEVLTARPLQAALASAAAFSVGGAVPLLVAIAGFDNPVATITATSLALLALLGATSAWVGGASPLRAAARVTFWGIIAMALTGVVGRLFGVALD